MDPNPRTILSASRRTDIPGAHGVWFMDGIRRGEFSVTNPFNRKTRQVDARVETLHAIVFWSKNYGPFLEMGAVDELMDMGHHLFFNFTLNTPDPLLEPGLPPLEDRLAQAKALTRLTGPRALAWRFDPICFYRHGDGPRQHNLGAFLPLADAMAELGVDTCITSFYDAYAKVDRRIGYLNKQGNPALRFESPSTTEKEEILQRMADQLADRGINLHLCCERTLLDRLILKGIAVAPGNCINGHRLRELYGGTPDIKKDRGQRAAQGCSCTQSVDIGSYEAHPCPHNCLFCYAHTGLDVRMKQEGKQRKT